MRYIGRNNEELTKEQWEKLLHNPTYTTIASKRVNGRWYDFSWLGLQPEREKEPQLFIIRNWAGDRDCEKAIDSKVEWFGNEEAGLARFKELTEL